MKKLSLSRFLAASALIHAAVFLSFFRFITAENGPSDREKSIDTVSWEHRLGTLSPREMAQLALSPLSDSLVFDSLWQTDSASILDLIEELNASDSLWTVWTNEGWYASTNERFAIFNELLRRYHNSPAVDSLFAVSEMLRQQLLKRILALMKRTPDIIPDSVAIWKRLMDMLALKLSHSKGGGNSAEAALRRRMLSALAADPELVRLWKEAMLFSLRNVALDSILSAVRNAARCALMHYCGRGPGNAPFPGAEGDGSGVNDLAGLSFRSGRFFSGIDNVPANEYEKVFAEILKKILKANGFDRLTPLMQGDRLVELLSREARNTLSAALSENAEAMSWARTIDFEKALSGLLDEAPHGAFRAGKEADEFFRTLTQGLGEDIASWLNDRPSLLQLKDNPHYFDGWARAYLSLLSNISIGPNLVMPNLEKFAEAAKKIRDRRLPASEHIILDGGAGAPADTIDYFIPKWVYLRSKPALPPGQAGARSLKIPDMRFHAFGGATRRTTPIVLDGNLEEWNASTPFKLCGAGVGLSSLPTFLGGSNCIMVQWDNRGLYFAYSIFDVRDNPHSVHAFWNTDALEIFIDPLNRKDPFRIDGRSFQFWAWPRAMGQPGSTGVSEFSSPTSFTPRPFKEGTIRCASIRSGERYTCEAFIPAWLAGKWLPLPGKIIGFNFSINNGEGVFIRWVTNLGANISAHPNLWGDLLLMGSDASIRMDPVDFLLPGQNLIVTIIDHDMNLSADEPDKVWVKVSSSLTGDKMPFGLLETGDDTGIFMGEIGTVFGFKPKVKQRISTRPGDQIEIYYLDQHRVCGEKNVPLTRTIPVVRGLMTLR